MPVKATDIRRHRRRSSRAARRRGGAISTRSTRQWRGSRSARRWAAPTSPMASPPAAQPTRTRCATATASQPRHRHRLQRHALGASALRDLSRADPRGGARGGRHGAGGRRRAGHVRRRHPGRAGHGAVAVLARRDRDVDGGRPVAPHVRCGRLSRRLRQDRAGPRHRRADLRPSARRVRPGRPDDLRPAQ